eukprot:GHVS01036917.1.p1 GENE.GHVS01036917.1~~GHVS01036917.1.p1  ORF type:complete len:160 (+),score=22.01 GHVS01036917.1:165-644(+)
MCVLLYILLKYIWCTYVASSSRQQRQQAAIDLGRTIVEKYQRKAGLAIKPQTPIDQVVLDVLASNYFSLFLVMTVEPGFGGQSFMEEMMVKLPPVRKRFPLINIQVDGGINAENVKLAADNGANVIVAGTSIMGAVDIPGCITNMRRAVDESIQKRNTD